MDMRFPATVNFKYLPFRETLLDAVFGELEPDETSFSRCLGMVEM